MGTMETKPGFKTTEFWLTLAAVVGSLVISSGILPVGSTVTAIVGGIVAVLGALGYGAVRASVKNKVTEAEAEARSGSIGLRSDGSYGLTDR